ncbi:MAG: TrkA family potassium uptake protein [Gaiellales bacterium]
MERFSRRRFVGAQLLFVAVLAVGTVGFRVLLDEDWPDAFYRAVATTTLTGLDTPPHTTASQIFSVGLLVAGVAIFLYLAGTVVELIAQGVFGGAFAERRRRRRIEMLRDHVIICGAGRVGRAVASEITAARRSLVVIDVNAPTGLWAEGLGAEFIHGDGTEDDDLRRAGIATAYALIASADSDERNVFITLSARALRPDLVIVARASASGAAEKLRRAGANHVVEPYVAAGNAMARQVVKPQVAALLDLSGTSGSSGLRFEELVVTRECSASGATLRELDLRGRTGASIVAVRRHDGEVIVTPAADDVLAPDDIVVAVGSPEQIAKLEGVFAPKDRAGV